MTTAKRQFSFLEQTLIGGASGVCEVLCTQPTVAVKNALQESRPMSFTPQFMYRGVAVSVKEGYGGGLRSSMCVHIARLK